MNDATPAHAEGLRLMWYACECGHRERIWNSRDGVTPFGLLCPSCGQGSLMHVEWRRDEYARGHQLNHGQRFFRDGTPEEAERIVRGRVAAYGDSIPADIDVEEMVREARAGQWSEFQTGWPAVSTHDNRAAE